MNRVKDFLLGAIFISTVVLVYGVALVLGYVPLHTPSASEVQFHACVAQVQAGNGNRLDCIKLLGADEDNTNLAEAK